MKYIRTVRILVISMISGITYAQTGKWQKIEPAKATQKQVSKENREDLNIIKRQLFGKEDVDLGSDDSPSPRIGAVSWLDENGDFYIFGGQGFDQNGVYGLFNDFWRFDKKVNSWTNVGGEINSQFAKKRESMYPSPRQNAISWKDGHGGLWLYGGEGIGSYVYYEDLWRYDIKKNTWQLISGTEEINKPGRWSKKFDQKSNPLGSRTGCSTWTDPHGNLLIFGGSTVDIETGRESFFNDLWLFDINKRVWTPLAENLQPNGKVEPLDAKTPSNKKEIGKFWPSVRKGALAWSAEKSGKLWLYGGFGSDENGEKKGNLSDMWCYDLKNGEWESVSGDFSFNARTSVEKLNSESRVNSPGFRFKSITWTDEKGNFWLVGGQNIISQNLVSINSDTWQFNPEMRLWKSVISSMNNMLLGTGAYDRNENTLWFFGNQPYNPKSNAKFLSNNIWKLSLK